MSNKAPKRTKAKAEKVVKLLKEKRVKTTADAMRLAGYTEKSVEQLSVGRTKAYKQYLATIDDVAIVERWKDWALNEDKDKRLALDAGKEVVKLKERNPDTKDDHKGNMPILNMVFKGDVSVEELKD